MKSRVKISLTVKHTTLVVVLLIISALISFNLSKNQLLTQQEQNEKSVVKSIADSLLVLEQQAQTDSITIAELLGGFANNSENFDVFLDSFQKSWDNISLIGNLLAVRVYELNTQEMLSTLGEGIYFEYAEELILNALKTPDLTTELYCKIECVFVTTVPVFDSDKPLLITIIEPFSEIASSLAKIHNVDVAVLNLAPPEKSDTQLLESWNASLVSVTNSLKIFPLLESLSSSVNLQEIENKSVKFEHDDSLFDVSIIYHEGEILKRNPILIFNNVTDKATSFSKHTQAMTLVIISSISVIGLSVIVLTLSPIDKIKKLTQVYPFILSKNFEQAGRLLPNKDSPFLDEIDLLHIETHELISTLHELYSDIEQKNKELEYQALHDELTGLANRSMLKLQLKKREQSKEFKNWALVMLDIDNFKKINDSMGHSAGDELLIIVANRLKETLRSFDIVCRLGGDEFIVLLDNIQSVEGLHVFMKKLFIVLQQPISIKSRKMILSVSAGINMVNNVQDGGIDPLKAADIALYDAKDDGKNCYKIFDQQMYHKAEQVFIIENDFEESLANGEFYLLFQPQVDSKQGRLIGFEALVRWQHKQLDLYPQNFIPILEESQKIIDLGRWVAENAIEALAKVNKIRPGLRMSINLSARQLFDDDLFVVISNGLQKHQLLSEQIELEITESLSIDDIKFAKKWLEKAHKQGLRVAIDDFGTGYSSLSYIRQLPFDTVKLDRTFIRGLSNIQIEETESRDYRVLSAIIFMIKMMDAEIVAEGVEDENHFKLLNILQCEHLQGFLIDKPITLDEAFEKLKNLKETQIWPTLVDKQADLQINSRN